ncbi:MAG: hypothetical protein K0R24_2357, partial [Gammaproteobacteria bacterium]|nr:hypothetical protein [Gammaproteobacteria bacterium]
MSGWKIILIISFFLFNIGYSAFAAESDSDEVFLLPLSSLNDKIFEYPSEVNQEPKRLTLASPEPLSNVSFENPTEVIYDSDSDIITLLEDRVFPSNEADPFQSFFVQHVKNNRDIPETSTHKYFRYSIKFITYPFASMAGIPLLYLVHQAAGNVVALDYIFGVSTVLTAGISRTFVTHQILENLDPMSEEEYLIKAPNNWKSRARHISFYTLGILASLPFTYAVYKYNDVKYLAIITLIAESALNTYAYYQLSFGASLLRCACSSSIDIDNAEKEREEIISSLDHFSLFLTSAPIQRVGQIVKDNITDADTLERFLENIQFEETQEVVAITWKRGYPRKAARFLALSLPMINLTRNAILAWESSKLIYDPIWFSILYTAAIIAPGVVLDVLGTDATVCTLFDNIYHCTTGASQ